MKTRLLLAGLAASLALAPASARPREQNVAYEEAQRGKIMSLPKIERQVRDHPSVRGATYLGPEFDAGSGVYRLKFMRGGRVMWVDVDARTGRVLRTSGD